MSSHSILVGTLLLVLGLLLWGMIPLFGPLLGLLLVIISMITYARG